jgi:hypothetical protein
VSVRQIWVRLGDRSVRAGVRLDDTALDPGALRAQEPAFGGLDVIGVEGRAWCDRLATPRARVTRSAGRDLVVVMRLEDDSSRAVLVGCGIGIDPDPCFAWLPPD